MAKHARTKGAQAPTTAATLAVGTPTAATKAAAAVAAFNARPARPAPTPLPQWQAQQAAAGRPWVPNAPGASALLLPSGQLVVKPVPAPAVQVAPQVGPAAYQPRRYAPTATIAVGPVTAPSHYVAGWLQGLLQQTIAAGNGRTCTMAAWVATVNANSASCPSKSKPVKGGVMYQFVSGYLRHMAKPQQQWAVVVSS